MLLYAAFLIKLLPNVAIRKIRVIRDYPGNGKTGFPARPTLLVGWRFPGTRYVECCFWFYPPTQKCPTHMGRLEAEDGRYLLVFAVAFALADSRVPTASFL